MPGGSFGHLVKWQVKGGSGDRSGSGGLVTKQTEKVTIVFFLEGCNLGAAKKSTGMTSRPKRARGGGSKSSFTGSGSWGDTSRKKEEDV